MDRVKKRKQAIWTLGTVVFLMLAFIVGIVAQSNHRNKQRNELVSEIYSTQVGGRDDLALATALIKNQEQIEYINNHRAILNIQLRSIPADASYVSNESRAELCVSLEGIYFNADAIAKQYGWSADSLKANTTNMLVASDCASY